MLIRRLLKSEVRYPTRHGDGRPLPAASIRVAVGRTIFGLHEDAGGSMWIVRADPRGSVVAEVETAVWGVAASRLRVHAGRIPTGADMVTTSPHRFPRAPVIVMGQFMWLVVCPRRADLRLEFRSNDGAILATQPLLVRRGRRRLPSLRSQRGSAPRGETRF